MPRPEPGAKYRLPNISPQSAFNAKNRNWEIKNAEFCLFLLSMQYSEECSCQALPFELAAAVWTYYHAPKLWNQNPTVYNLQHTKVEFSREGCIVLWRNPHTPASQPRGSAMVRVHTTYCLKPPLTHPDTTSLTVAQQLHTWVFGLNDLSQHKSRYETRLQGYDLNKDKLCCLCTFSPGQAVSFSCTTHSASVAHQADTLLRVHNGDVVSVVLRGLGIFFFVGKVLQCVFKVTKLPVGCALWPVLHMQGDLSQPLRSAYPLPPEIARISRSEGEKFDPFTACDTQTLAN
eukprot:TRINITY_DN16470_c0_g2_i1.p1 TRINITY_DN16470_c0_g2~~TRINITY_DN16470_c0_g2_i1.p1  ORF type:complete len:309 (-),score=9.97 TRINITY_DN16470_c0_g2_i1:288-1154(-)